jgi:hypothetical protein
LDAESPNSVELALVRGPWLHPLVADGIAVGVHGRERSHGGHREPQSHRGQDVLLGSLLKDLSFSYKKLRSLTACCCDIFRGTSAIGLGYFLSDNAKGRLSTTWV